MPSLGECRDAQAKRTTVILGEFRNTLSTSHTLSLGLYVRWTCIDFSLRNHALPTFFRSDRRPEYAQRVRTRNSDPEIPQNRPNPRLFPVFLPGGIRKFRTVS